MFFPSGLSAFVLAGVLSLAALNAAQAAPLTYTDVIKADRISSFKVDVTGRYALLNIRSTDMNNNGSTGSVWLKDLAQPEVAEIKLAISNEGAGNAQWAPDGKSIYFQSSRAKDGTVQVWKTNLAGSMATQVTRLPLDVGAFQITPDGKGLVLSLAVFPECKGDEIACTVKKQANQKADKSSGKLYTKIFVRHWDTWADGTRNHLFYVDMNGQTPVALTDGYDGDVPSMPFGDESDYTISPDSRTVYFSARQAGKSEPWSTNFDIYSVQLSGGGLTNLTPANQAMDSSPRLSPDGKTLAYLAMKRPGFEADRFAIMLRDANGKVRELAADWDRSVVGMQWNKDGKSLLVDADDVGNHTLFRVDIATNSVIPLSKSGAIVSYTETPRGMVYLQNSLNNPPTLYQAQPWAAFVDQGAQNLTHFDAELAKLTKGAYEQFVFKGWNNEDVYGYVIKPDGYVEGKTYPVAFLIHGGPQGTFDNSWSARWNPQTYSGAGYAVVMIDFHGSTGYGQAFTDAISQHWGDRPLEDLQKGWSAALKKYNFLDGDRACALGASYGGFMVNWMAGNWKEPWKCLVTHDGVFDTRAMGYTTEELWFEEWENGGEIYPDPAKYDKFNPALHAKDWSVPMLVIHSDRDFRIPVEQGIGVFTALQRQGIDSAFLRFPDENHWVLKPANSMMWHKTVFDWLDSHIGKAQAPKARARR